MMALSHLLLVPTSRRQWRPKVMYFAEMVVPQFCEDDIRRMFRLGQPAIDLLIRVVSTAVGQQQTTHARGRPAVSLHKQVFMSR